MLVSELITEASTHIHDPNKAEVNDSTWLIFAASAASDARDSGWLLPIEDDESLTCAEDTWSYDVPSDFAYVSRLLVEETINGGAVYIQEVPRHLWEVRLNGGDPVFEFADIRLLVPDKHIKVIGQKRPTIYTAMGNTVDPGMRSFLRERMICFGFRYAAHGVSELSQWRQRMADRAWASSEQFLMRHPQEFRMYPDAREVLGRA